MIYRNILVAIDDTDMGTRVLEHAGALAEALNARLTILSVAAPVPPYVFAAGVDVSRLEEEAIKEAERTVREAVDRLPGAVNPTTIVRQGHAGREIVDQVARGDHDLVVLGSRGRGRVAEGVFGSVVGDVHFAVHVPLLVVHPEDR